MKEVLKSMIMYQHTAGTFEQRAYLYLNASCREVKEPFLAGATPHFNGNVPGDLAIILSWEGASLKKEKTDVGLRLAAALKRFGLVDHLLWVMIENS